MSTYGTPPGQQPPPGVPQWPAPTPAHPNANAALIWGIAAVAGGLSCVLPILVSPVAWIIGARTVREIKESPVPVGGLNEAKAGMILGIVGTALLAVALVIAAAVILVVAAGP